MAKVKYVGDPMRNGEGPEKTTARGYAFVKGKETDVPDSDKEAVKRFSANPHFEVSQKSDKSGASVLGSTQAGMANQNYGAKVS